MKRMLGVVGLLFIVISVVWAAGLPLFYQSVSVTEANTTVTLTLTGQKILSLILINDGPYDVYFTTESGTATTSNAKLKVGESLTLPTPANFAVGSLGIICATGETATVRVYGLPYTR